MKKLLVFWIRYLLVITWTNCLFSQDGLFLSSNNVPYADAGPNIKVFDDRNIVLDGSQSYSDDGSKLKYTWILSPGLALNEENNFSSNLFIDTYDEKYLKSIKTSEEITKLKIFENDPGTKLEIILEVKNSLGFRGTDTLSVEYLIREDKSILRDTLLTNSKLREEGLKESNNITILKNNKVEQADDEVNNKYKLNDRSWLKYMKYSLMAGGIYFIIDLILFNSSEENKLEKPPGFPHDS